MSHYSIIIWNYAVTFSLIAMKYDSCFFQISKRNLLIRPVRVTLNQIANILHQLTSMSVSLVQDGDTVLIPAIARVKYLVSSQTGSRYLPTKFWMKITFCQNYDSISEWKLLRKGSFIISGGSWYLIFRFMGYFSVQFMGYFNFASCVILEV